MLTEQRWNAFQKDRLTETEIGKFVLCQAKEDNITRLFIHQFSKWMSAFTKEGWWDTFTICEKSCVKGFYLCQIEEFKIDKNGYLNMVVYPNKFIGEVIDEDAIAWDYLHMTNKFADKYKSQHWRARFNFANLNNIFNERFEASGYSNMENFIFAGFIQGEITLEEISDALEEKYEIEKLAEDINGNLKKYSEKYPLLVKKLPKDESWGMYMTRCTVNYLQDKSYEYDRLKLGNENNILNQVEEVFKYWEEVHKVQKEKKKAEKKLAKSK